MHMTTVNTTPAFITRAQARAYRKTINERTTNIGSGATLRDPVKDHDGLWIIPGVTHKGKTLHLVQRTTTPEEI